MGVNIWRIMNFALDFRLAYGGSRKLIVVNLANIFVESTDAWS